LFLKFALDLREKFRKLKRSIYFITTPKPVKSNEVDNKYIEDRIESRRHFIQGGEWDKAAEVTFELESYLTLHGFPQRSIELLQELEDKELTDKNRAIVYHRMGNLFLGFGDYDASLTRYQKSLEIKEKIGDIDGMAISMGQMGNLYFEQDQFETALKSYLQSFVILSRIGSPFSDQAKNDIALCRQKLPEVRFQAILKEFEIDPKVFDPEDDETLMKMAMQFFSGITAQAVATSKLETSAEDIEQTRSLLTQWIDQIKDDTHQEPVKNYFQFLLAYVNKEDYQTPLQNIDPELKTIFEKVKAEVFFNCPIDKL